MSDKVNEKILVVATPNRMAKECTCTKGKDGKIAHYSYACPFHRDLLEGNNN
jgi:hypothetical protein